MSLKSKLKTVLICVGFLTIGFLLGEFAWKLGVVSNFSADHPYFTTNHYAWDALFGVLAEFFLFVGMVKVGMVRRRRKR